MALARTASDYRRRIPASDYGVYRYRRNADSRQGFPGTVASPPAGGSGAAGNPLFQILHLSPARLITIRRPRDAVNDFVLHGRGVRAYQRGEDFFERNKAQISRSADTYRRTHPVMGNTVRVLQGLTAGGGSSVFTSLSPVKLVFQGINRYLEGNDTQRNPMTLMRRAAELYRSISPVFANTPRLFRRF